jgi:pyridoxal phosphate enzyme (YggS family)
MRQAALEEEIRQRLVAVQRRIAVAAERAGRDPSEIRLVVVTKGHPINRLHALVASDQRRLGENRVEEALPKIDALGELPGLTWHLVGPLQSRKIPLVGDHFDLVHAVDRIKVARLLDARSGEIGRRQAVLLECNVTGETSKAGWRVEESQAGAHNDVTPSGTPIALVLP